MGRTAGHAARVVGVERLLKDAEPLRPLLQSVKPKAPFAPSAPLPFRASAGPGPAAVVMTPPPSSGVAASPSSKRGTADRTVREILPPWQVLQDKLRKGKVPVSMAGPPTVLDRTAQKALEAQEAANASSNWGALPARTRQTSDVESREQTSAPSIASPPSVCKSETEHALPAVLPPAPIEVPEPALTFKAYTLAELERRSDAPVSLRSPRAAATPLPPRDVDWKRVGVRAGIVLGASLTLLFAVLTAAELTDDLKPRSSAMAMRAAASEPPLHVEASTTGAMVSVSPAVPSPGGTVSGPTASPMPAVEEIDFPAEPHAASGKKGSAAKRAAAVAAKAKTAKLSMRSAPF